MTAWYVRLIDSAKSELRSRFVTADGSTTTHRAKALRFDQRPAALDAAAKLREERPGCDAHVVNEKGRRRSRTITESHPGTDTVAKATGLSPAVILALAGVQGCPVVRGGRGKRFASVEAFRGFLAGLSPEARLKVPAYLKEEKLKVAVAICTLTWGGDAYGLVRRNTLAQLQAMLAEWQARDAADKARRA